MARGRKPNALAQVHVEPTILAAAPVDAETGKELTMPATVAMLPHAEQCWHIITDGQTRFTQHEVPLIESYCLAYAGMRQAIDNMTAQGDGTLQILTATTPTSPPKKSPNWAVFVEASDQMRKISGVLGLDTLTAERLNLTRATTVSIAADLPAKIREHARAMLDG